MEDPNEFWHGSWNGYCNFSCRCAPCMEAARVYRARPGGKLASKVSSVRKRYNLSWADLEFLYESQDRKCVICSDAISILPDEPNPAAIDHDHACCPEQARSCGKCVRGLLCRDCNQGIGKLKDSRHVLQRAIEYLSRASNIRSKDDVIVLR